ncbi:MAG TPA: GNAT family N-acetyltransferase [Dehalococcoidales bacterium]|nr:GNAT family N-acetyltransferase [Dehalococcoidales bacterium]
MKIKIRQMLKKDKPALMKILRNTPEFKASEVEVAEEVVDSYLHDVKGSGYYVLIAEAGSEVAGYICYGPNPLTDGTWDLYWQAVARERRGQGIGGALMKAAEVKIRQAQGRLAIIETSSSPAYEGTVRFHLGQGYEIICRIPDFYAPGDDKLILQKRLR